MGMRGESERDRDGHTHTHTHTQLENTEYLVYPPHTQLGSVCVVGGWRWKGTHHRILNSTEGLLKKQLLYNTTKRQ